MSPSLYESIYAEMRERNRKKLLTEGVRYDKFLVTNTPDTRRGLGYFSFQFQPTPAFFTVLSDAEKNFPHQVLYYPEKSKNSGIIHFTFLQLLKVGDANNDLSSIDLHSYEKISKKILKHLPTFTVTYRGLIAISTGIVLYGYPSIDINPVRELLRKEMTNADLPYSEPFPNNIAHSTLIRLSENEEPKKLLSFAEKYQDCKLGKMTVNSLELGYGTWKMKDEECKMITTYSLR